MANQEVMAVFQHLSRGASGPGAAVLQHAAAFATTASKCFLGPVAEPASVREYSSAAEATSVAPQAPCAAHIRNDSSASTSSSSLSLLCSRSHSTIPSSSNLAQWQSSLLHSRAYGKVPYYNFVQPIEAKYLQEMLDQITYLEQAVVPVLKYSQCMDPQQTTSLLEKLPRVYEYQQRRQARIKSADGAEAAAAVAPEMAPEQLIATLAGRLGDRLVEVLPDCSPEQVVQGLWGLGYSRIPHEKAFAAAAQLLPSRLPDFSPQQLATVAWAFGAAAATAAREGKDGSGLDQAARALLPAIAGQVVAESQELDQRSITKLAWAFAKAGVKDDVLLGRLCSDATAIINRQLEAHDPSSGPLAPAYTYRYWTIKGWVEKDKPLPPRASKYERDNSPILVARSFELSRLAPLLSSLAALGHLDAGLMAAVARHVQAAEPNVTPRQALQLAGACRALGYREPQLLASALAQLPLADATPSQLLQLLGTCVALGLADKPGFEGRLGVTRRLLLGLTRQMDQLGTKALAQAATIAARLQSSEPVVHAALSDLIAQRLAQPQAVAPQALAALAAAASQLKLSEPLLLERLAAAQRAGGRA